MSSSFRRNIVIGLFTLMWFVGCSAVERHLTVVPESQVQLGGSKGSGQTGRAANYYYRPGA
jgi:hypothetical protein